MAVSRRKESSFLHLAFLLFLDFGVLVRLLIGPLVMMTVHLMVLLLVVELLLAHLNLVDPLLVLLLLVIELVEMLLVF